jgi:hypothetical protein
VTVFAVENLPDGKHLLGVLARGAKRTESQGTALRWSRVIYPQLQAYLGVEFPRGDGNRVDSGRQTRQAFAAAQVVQHADLGLLESSLEFRTKGPHAAQRRTNSQSGG